MKAEYEALIEAAQELERIKREISRADGNYTSPAWKLVCHAQRYITYLADMALRAAVEQP